MSKRPLQKPIEIKISTVVAVSAILHTADVSALDIALQHMTAGAADFFEDDLALIDVAALPSGGEKIDWAGLIALLKAYRLNAVAVRNATPEMWDDIVAHGLGLDNGASAREEAGRPALESQILAVSARLDVPEPAASTASGAESATKPGAMFIDSQVRAGQRIYARGCDLIITGIVNNGAEIIADGSIHVYSALYGRALAGASGDTSARIFALTMAPELVSIAGVYRTFDEGFPAELARQPVQITLVGDRLDILSVNFVSRS